MSIFAVVRRLRVSCAKLLLLQLLLLATLIVDVAPAALRRRPQPRPAVSTRACPAPSGSERWLHPCGDESFPPPPAARGVPGSTADWRRVFEDLELMAQRLAELANSTVNSYVSPLPYFLTSQILTAVRLLTYLFTLLSVWSPLVPLGFSRADIWNICIHKVTKNTGCRC